MIVLLRIMTENTQRKYIDEHESYQRIGPVCVGYVRLKIQLANYLICACFQQEHVKSVPVRFRRIFRQNY